MNNNNNNKDVGVCIFCEQLVYREGDELRYVPLDRPIRIDLPVHKTCYKLHARENTIKPFIQEHLLEYLEKYYEENEHVKKKRKVVKPIEDRSYEREV